MTVESAEPIAELPLLNRELSWLAFNKRVLSISGRWELPVLERLKFLSIWSSNLDEFFQVRVAGLKAEVEDSPNLGSKRSPDGLTVTEQLLAIREEVKTQYRAIAANYKLVRQELGEFGIHITKWQKLSERDQKNLTEQFIDRVFPVLTPLAVDPGHPFPYISALSLSIAVLVRDPRTGQDRFARIKIPTELLGRYMRPKPSVLVPLEQVIGNNLDQLFPGMEVVEWAAFRITRDADQPLEDRDAEDLLRAVETQLEQRKFGDVVRLELFHKVSPAIRAILMEELGVSEQEVYHVKGLIDLGSGAGFEITDRPDLRLERWSPEFLPGFGDEDGAADLFSVIRSREVLMHHPYVSFDSSVLELIRQASVDPSVQAIKITLYRTAGDGRIVDALIRAASEGKQVVVLVELKARFDEEANIAWARRLERAGVHVTYGLVGLKVHAKVLLIVRQESGELRRYCHIGSGNYNSKTARSYTDLGLMTCNREVGHDLSMLFNSLTGFGVAPNYQRLLVAPEYLRTELTDRIRNEAEHGSAGHIVAKMNSLVDPEMVRELYAASRAGVRIELIVRGSCALMPGVPGVSETITVRSILGRYLEHSRIYYFANGDGPGQPQFLLGSADLMPRNLNRRVEVLVPIVDPELQEEVREVLDVGLRADRTTWELTSTGEWSAVEDLGACDPQHVLWKAARARVEVKG